MLPGTLSASRRRAQSLKARHPTAGLPARIHARNLVHLGVKGDCLPSQAQSLKAREREEERERESREEKSREDKRSRGRTKQSRERQDKAVVFPFEDTVYLRRLTRQRSLRPRCCPQHG